MEELGGSILQSWEWGEFRARHGWKPLRLHDPEAGSAQVLVRNLPGVGALAYAPHGPLSPSPQTLGKVSEALVRRMRHEGACLLEVEPRTEEAPNLPGFRRREHSVQPRCTFVVGILEDEETQLSGLPKDTRYRVRRARREGITVKAATGAGEPLEEFLSLHEETARRHGFAIRPRQYYRQFMADLPAQLITARYGDDNRLIAGAIILTFGEEAYYLYGASAEDTHYASYLVQWEILNAARRAGARRYDMWGIPCEPSEEHPLWGVYRFKKKFAGDFKHYAGSYERAISPIRARLARAGIGGYYALQKALGRGSGPLGD